jgi:hypothetical protein
VTQGTPGRVFVGEDAEGSCEGGCPNILGMLLLLACGLCLLVFCLHR